MMNRKGSLTIPLALLLLAFIALGIWQLFVSFTVTSTTEERQLSFDRMASDYDFSLDYNQAVFESLIEDSIRKARLGDDFETTFCNALFFNVLARDRGLTTTTLFDVIQEQPCELVERGGVYEYSVEGMFSVTEGVSELKQPIRYEARFTQGGLLSITT